MPTIPIVTAQQGPGVLQLPQIRRQQGFEEVSQLGADLMAIDEKIQAQQDELNLAAMSRDSLIGKAQIEANLKQDSNYAGHGARFALEFNALNENIIKQYPNSSPTAIQAFTKHQLHSAAVGLVEVRTNALKLQGEAQTGDFLVQQEFLAKQAVEGTPDQQIEAVQNRNRLRTTLTNSGTLDPLQSAKVDIAWKEMVAENTFLRDLRENPDRAKELLDNKGYPDLSAHAREVAYHQYETMKTHREEQAKQARHLLQEQEKVGFYRRLEDPNIIEADKVKLTADVLNSPNLTAENMDYFMKRLKGTDEKFFNDPKVMAQALQDIRKGKITTGSQLEQLYTRSANRNSGIDYGALEHLQKQLDEMRTPEGRLLGPRKEEMFKGVKGSIDKSVFGKETDPDGSLLFLQYQEWVDAQLAAYKQTGKNPNDLLDPQNPNYLARPAAIAPYQRSLVETLNDKLNKLNRPDRAPLPKEKQPLSNETTEQYLKRTRK